MANKPAITLEIGAAVNPTVSAALNAVQERVSKLDGKLGAAMRLDNDIQKYLEASARLHEAQQAKADSVSQLQSVMDRHLDTLRKQGVEAKGLGARYEALGEAVKAYKQQIKGHEQLAEGRAGLVGLAGLVTLASKPVKVSGDYQAQLRDISLKTGADAATEREVTRQVIDTSNASGMSRNQVAQLLAQMIGKGMSLKDARNNLPTAATFAVGQNAGVEDTATLMRSLQQRGLGQPEQTRAALELLVTQAKEGGFDSAELAKWVPKLLPKVGSEQTGLAAVGEVGALLQGQMVSANGTDEAAAKVGTFLDANPKGFSPDKNGESQAYGGDIALHDRLRKLPPQGGSVLDDDLKSRQGLSKQQWSQTGNAFDDLQRSLGDGMRPVTDVLAQGATAALQGLTKVSDACTWVVTGLTGLAVAAVAVGTVYRGLQVGKGLLDLGAGLSRERQAGAKGLPSFKEATGGQALGGKQPIDVRVVNLDALARSRRSGGGRNGRKGKGTSPRGAARSGRGKGVAVQARPAAGVAREGAQVMGGRANEKHGLKNRVGAKGPGGITGFLGSMGGAVTSRLGGVLGSAKGLLRRVPGLSQLETGRQLWSTVTGKGSWREKLQGVGVALGGQGGAMAGAAAGAALGSVVPVLGTAIGGLLGSMVGSAYGEEAVGWLASLVPGAKKPSEPASTGNGAQAPLDVGAVARTLDDTGAVPQAAAGVMATASTSTLGAPPVPANQQFTFTANMPVTFNNSLDDPSVLAQLEAIARRTLMDLMARANDAQMSDTVHV
ncbi:hypothetical protein P0Y43_07385 [Pseudomonas entomophila]|uniref:phage tail tape measure protein n=1 Tax=Pseudomonas entomophila TaxID=312306 RepID=UPI0023D7CDF7|nr:phage tail tape measure protein [Pseudomonas entomophila]MDF0730556.1 hypothetical protein [Pseudomonas entomophila]